MSELSVYKASAGSGKTYKLTEHYLFMLFGNPARYKNILAVTFTNKATGEMKHRIIKELSSLATGDDSSHYQNLKETLAITDHQIKETAGKALRYILHDYSRFSVSTIDHFFQRVIRTFAREMGLQSGYTLETDDTEILNYVIDQLLLDTVEDNQLKDWLVEFASSRMQEGKSWNFRDSVMGLARELTKEHVKDLSLELKETVSDKDTLGQYVKVLKKELAYFENSLAAIGKKGVELIESNQLTVEDFFYKKKGPANYFYQLANKSKFAPNSYCYKVLETVDKWPASSAKENVKQQVSGLAEQLTVILQKAVNFYEANFSRYTSVKEIYSNIYVLGILVDIQKRMDAYCREKNLFLISDASDLLRKIIDQNDAPFIYEKTGSIFQHFLIDEFQDTSRFQWDNFLPLVSNSLAQNGKNLLVGDVKQSIYRWRNSDWKILSDEVQDAFPAYPPNIKFLDNNYRSLENIIAFNNTIFSGASVILQQQFNNNIASYSLENPWEHKLVSAYADVAQGIPFSKPGGYVHVGFYPYSNAEKQGNKQNITQQVITDIEMLQDEGYTLSDIAVVVRKNNEGQEVANALLERKNNSGPDSRYKYDVISNDSLFVANAQSVQFILSVFRYFTDSDDPINKAFFVETYQREIMQNSYGPERLHELFYHPSDEDFQQYLPPEFVQREHELRKMPLYELTEQIIFLFGLQVLEGEVTYLQAFQSMVLNFSRRYAADLNSFLNWWDERGSTEKLQLPENYNAIRIVTIHKSKGLEFKAVILPFCDWELDASSSGLKKNFLWPTPKDEGLDQLQYVPVNYKKSLAETSFAEDYFTEQFHNYVDNLNLLYVANTRAEEVLISYAPLQRSKEGGWQYQTQRGIATVAELMHYLLENSGNYPESEHANKPYIDSLANYWDSDQCVFNWGQIKHTTDQDHIQDDHMVMRNYPVYEKLPPLRLSYEHQGFFNETTDLFEGRIDQGKLMHQLFEWICKPEDIPAAVEKIYMEGKIGKEESLQLEKRIEALIKDDRVRQFFTSDWQVFTEREILLPSGRRYRPDRVMINDQETIVLDYKFGEKMDKKHHKQIFAYLKQIRKMGYTHPRGIIWYVNQMEIIEVSTEK